MNDDDDVRIDFAFDGDNDDLFILFDKPTLLNHMRLSRPDAYALHLLLQARFEPKATAGSSFALPVFISHCFVDDGVFANANVNKVFLEGLLRGRYG